MIMNLRSSPIDAVYLSLEELILAVNHHAESEGYAVVKQRSKKSPKTDQVVKVYLRCDRGGKPDDKSHEQKRKHSATRLVDCPFSCFALDKADVGWILVVRDSSHNHPPTIEGAHSALRKLAITSDTVSKIDNQSKAQATPAQVLTFMRLEDEGCILRSRDIYNVKQAIRRKILESLTSTQFLLKNLDRDN
jgi:hypothetical protein